MTRIAAALALAAACTVQQPIQTPAATQPGSGQFLVQEQLRLLHADRGLPPGVDEVTEYVADTQVTAGVRGDLSVAAQWQARYSDVHFAGGGHRHDGEGGDLSLRGRWRFLQRDSGPLDTERALLWLGGRLDTGDGPLLLPGGDRTSSNPQAGIAYTRIAGRLGIDAAADYEATTDGQPDMLRYGGAVLWRLAPARFRADSDASWYALVELDAYYEGNGDHELLASPGVMMEARRWTFEAAIQLPVTRELDHRPQVDFAAVLGLRYLF